MNEKIVKLQKAINDYRSDVVSHINEQEPLGAVDISDKSIGITNLSIAGEPFLVFSKIGEDGKIERNITSIKFSSIEDVARVASWLKVIQNEMIQNATLSTIVPVAEDTSAEAKAEEATAEAPADAIAGTKE